MRARAALLLVWLAACAPTYAEGYQESLGAGLRAQNAGRYEEAVAAFEKAADIGDRYKDRDEARLLAAGSLEKLGRWDEAEATYRRVERESDGRYQGVRAAFETGRVVWEQRGFDEGSKELLAAVRKYPSSGLVRHAVMRMREHVEDESGPDAALAWLLPIRASLAGTEAEEAVEYEYAKLLARCGKKEDSIRALLREARKFKYPAGSLTDDAYFVASLFLEDVGRPKEAIDVLEEMMRPAEAAYAGASYERPRWPEGAFRIGMLYRDALKDRARAKIELRRAYDEHTPWRHADRVLWTLAKTFHEDGEERETCETLERLKKEKPDSRYLRCIHELCPSMPAEAKPCQPYLRESIGLEREDPSER